MTDRLYLFMLECWKKGIPPSVARKCRMEDIMFLDDYNAEMIKAKEDAAHEAKIKQIMESMI